MNWVDPRERTLDELWEAALGIGQLVPSHFGGIVMHSGVGWQVLGGFWPEPTSGMDIRGKGVSPRSAILDFFRTFEEEWVAHPPHRWQWQQET